MAKQIGYVVGSLRKDSINRKLANALIRLGPADFTFKELRIGDLPLYDQDQDNAQAPEVQRLKSELRAVDAVLFVTPEYNRSIPGVLKNALDHASRP
jgi:chromate reductase